MTRDIVLNIRISQRSLRRLLVASIVVAAIGLPTWIFASEVGALITFTSGTPIVAADVNANFAAVKAAVDDNDVRIAAMESQEPALPTPAIWSGGCSVTGQTDGFLPYCLDSTDFNTAQNHLAITDVNQGEITFSQAGYYRVRYWGISSSDAISQRVLYNGASIHDGVSFSGAGTSNQNIADITWPFAVGDTVAIDAYAQGGEQNYRSWRPTNASSRLQVQYVGPL